ncbi:hypothetical protein HOT99_gp025 [Caulobacter phage CcrBL10]|uniref:Uncharacterized protein n=1 Tax=Caulobacter phage CcrBL10 TaxID=2283269 RepID=A0A385EC14_9CAUD|nr:hypothetical protein HOT99_gp025 [Caulobacter phage CcrBL10]AXQ68229.1 hypothetical protein CcrBL10_gp025 [Caulobacter phage CcrBL10]
MNIFKRLLYRIAGVAPISLPKTAALVAAVWWATRMDVDKAVDLGTSDEEKLRIVDTFQDELCRLIDGKMRRLKGKDSALFLDFDYGPDPLLGEALRVAGVSRSVWSDLWPRKTRMTVQRHQLSVKPGYHLERYTIPIGES